MSFFQLTQKQSSRKDRLQELRDERDQKRTTRNSHPTVHGRKRAFGERGSMASKRQTL